MKSWGPFALFAAIATAVCLVFSIAVEAVVQVSGYEEPKEEKKDDGDHSEDDDHDHDEEGRPVIVIR